MVCGPTVASDQLSQGLRTLQEVIHMWANLPLKVLETQRSLFVSSHVFTVLPLKFNTLISLGGGGL